MGLFAVIHFFWLLCYCSIVTWFFFGQCIVTWLDLEQKHETGFAFGNWVGVKRKEKVVFVKMPPRPIELL